MGENALDAAAAVLPAELSAGLKGLSGRDREEIEELRLRRGFPLTAVLPSGERDLEGTPIGERHLRQVLENASQASAHTVLEQIRNGFVTLRGGHRIGLCGTVSRRDGETVSLRYLSSLSIRVARAVGGQAAGVLPELLENGVFQSTLILGPPGAGKTTLLRDLVRALSDGDGTPPQRVGVADERGEIAALWQGEAQFYVGRRTDVLDGYPKAEGLTILLRGMNPQVLAADEITHPADVAAVTEAAGCGAALLATAHGGGVEDLGRRPVYRALLAEGVFRRVVLVERRGGGRAFKVEVLL